MLFWDTEPSVLDAQTHREFILQRLLEYGGIAAVRWAERRYGLDGIREYILTRGNQMLTAKTRSFWRAVLNLTEDTCTTKSSPLRNNPLWPF